MPLSGVDAPARDRGPIFCDTGGNENEGGVIFVIFAVPGVDEVRAFGVFVRVRLGAGTAFDTTCCSTRESNTRSPVIFCCGLACAVADERNAAAPHSRRANFNLFFISEKLIDDKYSKFWSINNRVPVCCKNKLNSVILQYIYVFYS